MSGNAKLTTTDMKKIYEDVLDDIDEIKPEADTEQWSFRPGYAHSVLTFTPRYEWSAVSDGDVYEMFSSVVGTYASSFEVHVASGEEMKKMRSMFFPPFDDENFIYEERCVISQFNVPQKDAPMLMFRIQAMCPKRLYRIAALPDGTLALTKRTNTSPSVAGMIMSGGLSDTEYMIRVAADACRMASDDFVAQNDPVIENTARKMYRFYNRARKRKTKTGINIS